MRRFSSYGPVDKDLHFYVPRESLVQRACDALVGEAPAKGGHYITVWAPRQCGKTWIMREALHTIRRDGRFDVGMISLQSAMSITTDAEILDLFVRRVNQAFSKQLPPAGAWDQISRIFDASHFDRPAILIIDEFDALADDFINKFANELRDIYLTRQTETDKTTYEQDCMLHGLALIGVRSVLGIENITGSPFNIQRSMPIPNLTRDEVGAMFDWYERESGQPVEPEAAGRVFAETQGQPGLVSWLGELLTETYNRDPNRLISKDDFESIYQQAVQVLPNNNILNIISKARQTPYVETVLELFRTSRKSEFAFDDPHLNFLYMNGVIGIEDAESDLYVKFSCPFVQKRLFNYFSRQLFGTLDRLHDPLADIASVVGETSVDVPALMGLYREYLAQNRAWLLKDAPRRKTDLRIYEAVFHFNLYMYLKQLFQDKGGEVFPEFPTGNGKVDILIRHAGQLYALELKSFRDRTAHARALPRAADYADRLGLDRIYLILFIEEIDDDNRKVLEAVHEDDATGVKVVPIFVETGNHPPPAA